MQSKAWLATNRIDERSSADQLLGRGVGLPVRLEVAGLLHGDHVVEGKADVRAGGLQHVADRRWRGWRACSRRARSFSSAAITSGKGLSFSISPTSQRTSSWRVGDAAAVHDVGHGAVADLPVGRVAAVEQRVDHRVLEVRAPPPRHEAVGRAVPALLLQERRDGLGQPLLHVDDGAVLVEGQRLDLALEDLEAFHGCLKRPKSTKTDFGRRGLGQGLTTVDHAAPFIAAITLSGVKGTERSRTPIASNTAFEIAEGTTAAAGSPAPHGRSFGRSIRS